MQYRHIKSMLVLACSLWMAVACTPVARDDPGASDVPPDTGTAAAASESGEEPDEAQSNNPINRFWAPFDKAVDDINRDINEGDAESASESTE